MTIQRGNALPRELNPKPAGSRQFKAILPFFDVSSQSFPEEAVGFDSGDENRFRYVWNSPLTKVDPSGLLDLKLQNVPFVHNSGKPGYQLNWNVLINDPIVQDSKEGRHRTNTQLWIITKSEIWSVYQGPDGKWIVYPGKGRANVTYKGDFVTIGRRDKVGDQSRSLYTQKNGLQWAFWIEQVQKTIGYNKSTAPVAESVNVSLTADEANKYIGQMEFSSGKWSYEYTYVYMNAANLALSKVKIADEIPEIFKKEMSYLLKKGQIAAPQMPQDPEKISGIILNSAQFPLRQFRFIPLRKP